MKTIKCIAAKNINKGDAVCLTTLIESPKQGIKLVSNNPDYRGQPVFGQALSNCTTGDDIDIQVSGLMEFAWHGVFSNSRTRKPKPHLHFIGQTVGMSCIDGGVINGGYVTKESIGVIKGFNQEKTKVTIEL